MQREAYVDLWCSCQIGDAYIDLSMHLIDTYTRSKVNAAPPLSPNPTPRDDCTRNPPNIQIHSPLLGQHIGNASQELKFEQFMMTNLNSWAKRLGASYSIPPSQES